MPQPPRDCPGICPELPGVLGDIRVELREIKVEMRETLKRTQEHLTRIDETCPKHENRIRSCEDELLEIQTVAKMIPWTGKILWGMFGIAVSATIYLANKLLPYLWAAAQAQR